MLDPVLAAELGQPRILIFGAVEILTPGGAIRLLDGAGEVPIGANRFVGRDPTWGVLDSIRGLSESMSDTSPAVTIGILPSGDLALSALIDPALQGSAVSVTIGAIDRVTGLAVGEPYVFFAGEIDVPTVKWAGNDRRMEFRAGSIGERLFSVEEGRRLSHAFHTKVWPGELGLEFVTDIESTVPWGQQLKTDSNAVRSDLPGYGASGGFTGGGLRRNYWGAWT